MSEIKEHDMTGERAKGYTKEHTEMWMDSVKSKWIMVHKIYQWELV